MPKQQIIEAIKSYSTIIIHRHVRPDPDALGSQGGVQELIKASFPDKQVYVVGEVDPSLAFLLEMDEIADDMYKEALIITCDTANTDRISDTRYHLGQKLIKIDHHPNTDPYGDISWIDTEASSTSEMIYELFLHGKDEGLQLNDKAAASLYAGIVGDTGRFLFPSTTKKTFQYAADLVAYQFDRTALYDGIYNVKQNIARLRGYVLQRYELSENGLSTIKLTQDVLASFQVDPVETGQLVGILGEVEGIKAWVFFIEEEDLIRVRLRSKGPVINKIAANYNGGGHPMASGATVYSWEEAEQVVQDLEEVCRAYK